MLKTWWNDLRIKLRRRWFGEYEHEWIPWKDPPFFNFGCYSFGMKCRYCGIKRGFHEAAMMNGECLTSDEEAIKDVVE